ncbi:D-alanine--D-alanine ligase [Acidihalobacter ferrooxydans]|uniref:D-alanine--D-alanine ligase n=1 Tax=Acidihalobacter ferrooxydans TaxID=1765967 RepID=A0A1P8UE58_9GAMM|nr:D-alanine--D-alanine ligase [Acidihalobacter ferrooxydans]APZ42142.1 D-alanine--D-alanine ligase [Acidihalobacter ferrooxydans]
MNIDPQRFGRVGVLMGGWSAEREVSLQSGASVTAALRIGGVDAVAVDLRRETAVAQITEGGFDRCFPIIHGTGGEDGTLQALLDLLGLPYTGSGVLGSALGMDKLRCKQIWRAQGLPVVPGEVAHATTDFAALVQRHGLPLFVKPSEEGSSVGVTRVKRAEDLPVAYAAAAACHGAVLVEPAMAGGDYTVAVLGAEALPAIRIVPAGEFYDYAAKYTRDDTRYLCPCGLPDATERALRDLAVAAFAAVGGKGWGRVDFLFDAAGAPYVAEVNTVPGMTGHSLVPMAARAVGMDMTQLVLRILAQTLPAGDRDGA